MQDAVGLEDGDTEGVLLGLREGDRDGSDELGEEVGS